MRSRITSLWVAAFCALAVLRLSAVELKPATLAVFERYVRLTEARMAGEVDGSSPFLWIDRQPAADRAALFARLTRGEVVAARLETLDEAKRIEIGGGLIHHWIGTVLLTGVTLDRATTFVQAYERYPDRFTPMIQRSRVIAHAGDHFDVAMRTWMKKLTIAVVIDADYVIDYRRLSSSRLYTKNVATNVMEVDAAGTPDERRTPVDQTRGFLWRLNTYCWFEERSEGTYEQCESMSLTRAVPFGLGWLIKGFVTSIPRETLEFTLGQVRDGVAR